MIPQPIISGVYRAQQLGLLLPALVAQRVMRTLVRRKITVDPEAERVVKQRYGELLATDLDNVRQGMYPRALLFQFPFRQYVKQFPELVRDLPRTVRRMEAGDYQDLPAEAKSDRYPPYFRRTFHWQTDGYFSRRSARLYDVGVEFLFMGTADVMRRQVIPPITRYLRERGITEARVLDVACGTGRTLLQLAMTHPRLRYYGVDISPYYIAEARRLLAHVPDVSLIAENGESLPFVDGHFDVVTSTYLFHELPHNARRRVLAEAYRALKPGGLLVVQDSAQFRESKEIAFFLDRFSTDFHEPFHSSYLRDDLSDLFEESGFVVDEMTPHYVAKVVVGRKPA